MYLAWDEKKIIDFSAQNISALYNQGYLFTRRGKGVLQQTRSLRIDLSEFTLNSENKRILRKTKEIKSFNFDLPLADYDWKIGKIAKNFYDAKFDVGTFSANKIKELLTDETKSNFNMIFQYSLDKTVGYAICYENDEMLHYAYPFYTLTSTDNCPTRNLGMGMMLNAIIYAKKHCKNYIYLGSVQRPTDIYKLQFSGLEWFSGNDWNLNISELKKIIL